MSVPQWAIPVSATPPEWLPALDIPGPGRQRRLTVLARWLLLLPQFVVLFLLGIAAFFVLIAGWFAALFTGRLPRGVAGYLSGFLAYETRVQADAMLLVDRYPPFSLHPADPYPVRIEVRPGRLNRLAVLFRIIPMIPAAIVQGLAASGWYAVSVIVWLVVLILGRMPRPLFQATAAVLRYGMRFRAYTYMLTSAYPKRLFGDDPQDARREALYGLGAGTAAGTGTGGQAAPAVASATRPLLMSTGAKVLVVLFLLLGLAGSVVSDTVHGDDDQSAAPPGRVSRIG
jgi:hypothetical protein